jgi:hypothetical protein
VSERLCFASLGDGGFDSWFGPFLYTFLVCGTTFLRHSISSILLACFQWAAASLLCRYALTRIGKCSLSVVSSLCEPQETLI